MTEQEAVRTLQEMYERMSADGDRSVAAVLFGILHADDVAYWPDKKLRRIIKQATGTSGAYVADISKGRRAAFYLGLTSS